MSGYRLQARALVALDDIYRYSCERWSLKEADAYVGGFFETFEKLGKQQIPLRVIPGYLGVSGFRHRYRRHFIYWRPIEGGTIVIFAILHDRMQQSAWLDDTDTDQMP